MIENQVQNNATSKPYPAVKVGNGWIKEGRWEMVKQLTYIGQVFNPLEAKKGKKSPIL